jgi:hypothetical protein
MTSAVAVALSVLLGATASTGRLSPTSDLSQNKVTATGSTTARSLAARFSDAPNAADFGVATGASAATNTTNLASAMAAAKVVRLSAGHFAVTSLTIPTGVTLEGAGPEETFIETATTGDAMTIGGERVTLRGFTLKQTGPKQGKGIVGADKYWLTTERVTVTGFDYGVYQSKSIYHHHKLLIADGNNYGVYYWGAAGVWNTDWFNNAFTFDECRANANTNVGFYIKGAEGVLSVPDSSGNGTGFQILGDSTSYPAHAIQIIAPYVESTPVAFSFSYARAGIGGGFFQGGPSGPAQFTSIIDAANYSEVKVRSELKDQDYWQYRYRVTNNSKLTLERQFNGSVFGSASVVDATSSAGVDDYEEGTYAGTLTGFASGQPITVSYVRQGKVVTLSIPQVGTTSTTTAMTLTGMPATLRPTNAQTALGLVLDDGADFIGVASVAADGTITFYKGTNLTAFTASGTKGVRQSTLTFALY